MQLIFAPSRGCLRQNLWLERCRKCSHDCSSNSRFSNGETLYTNRYRSVATTTISSIRHRNRHNIATPATSKIPSPLSSREFSSTHSVLGKKQKKTSHREEDPAQVIPPEDVVNEAFDFSDLDHGFSKHMARLKDELSKLRPGGRLDPEMIEGLRVHTRSGSMEKLGDLATVVPKGGRTISVIVAEEENLKPITSALLSSPYSLTPQPDPHTPLTLLVPVPPPTAESRSAVQQTAKDLHEKAATGIKLVRQDFHKKLRKIELDKKTRVPKDEMAKAHKEMEKKTEEAGKEIKKVWEEKSRALER